MTTPVRPPPVSALSSDDWRLLIETVQDYAIFMLDPSGRVVSWNRGAEAIKGYRSHEIIGHHFSTFYPPEQQAEPDRELEVVRKEGRIEREGWRVRKDGSRFWANVVITALYDEQGKLRGFAKVTRDLTARLRADQVARELIREQASRAMAEASEARIRESEERYRELSHRLEVILEGVADGITVQDRSGKLIFGNTAAAKISGYATRDELLHVAPADLMARFELRDEQGQPLSFDALPGRQALRGELSNARLVHVRDRATGRDWWLRMRATSVTGASGEAELAVNILHDVTDDKRREQHDRYVAQTTAALAESLDYTAMPARLTRLLVPSLADWCAVHLLDQQRPVLAAVAHVDPQKAAWAEELGRRFLPQPEDTQGLWNVLHSGVSELYPALSDALLSEHARDAEHLAALHSAGMRSALIVAIRAQGRVLGCISLFSADSGRAYDAKDVALAEELGRRAGTAIENARLYAAERKARDQVALVARAGEAFSSALDYETMLQNVVEIALPTLGDYAFLDLVEPDGVRRIAMAHADPHADALIKATHWVRSERQDKNLCALSSGASGFHPQIDDAWLIDVARSPEHLALLRELTLVSMITVPLRMRGEVLGSLTCCFGRSGRHHTGDDLKLGEELARRAAVAVAQARLYAQANEAARKAEQAAQRAEEANRLKDEFLAMLSHELRTPLNAIMGWASVLRGGNTDPSASKGLEVIHRNAHAQARIIDDLLDVSRIITGKLRLDLRECDVVALVLDALEVIRPSAMAKDMTLAFQPPDEPCLLVVDPERIAQVLWNLLSNAVKFSEPGGRIEVALVRQGARVTLSVRDSGQGIGSAFLPFVFERFRQADSSATRRFGGLGLGLAIVRHLVELHGGTVSAHSAGVGQGATFVVQLPVLALTPQPERQADPPASAAPSHSLRGSRVLLVDDEPDARELLAAVLVREGAVVETAGSAAEGMALLESFRPSVLVSDIGMPEEDGYVFIRRVNALAPSRGGGIPSLALTAYAGTEDKAKALGTGFTTYLSKPVNPEDLVAAVANLTAFVRR